MNKMSDKEKLEMIMNYIESNLLDCNMACSCCGGDDETRAKLEELKQDIEKIYLSNRY